jgi:icmB protein
MGSILDARIIGLMAALKTEISDYCDIQTVDGKNCLVTSDGTYGSIIHFNGVKSVISNDQFLSMAQAIADAFEPYLRKLGYNLQVLFVREDDSLPTLKRCADAQRESARSIGLSMGDLIDESVDTLRRYTYQEDCYLVLWTSHSLLNSAEMRKEAADRNRDKIDNDLPSFADAQNPFVVSDFLHSRHESYVSSIFNALNSPSFNCDVRILDVNEALRAIRKSVYPRLTSDDWEAVYPGQPHALMWKNHQNTEDMSEGLYRPLNEQIMSRSAEIGSHDNPVITGTNRVRIGNRIFSPLVIEVPPKKPDVFQTLFDILNNTHTRYRGVVRACPYAISFMIKGDGMSSLGWNSILSTLLQALDSRNKSLKMAVERLSILKSDGQAIVKMAMTAMTWIDEDDNVAEELPLREKGLNDALQQWGHPQVGERTGDPMEVVQSTALALSTNSVGTPAAAPLYDAVALLPLSRPASPFSIPSTYFRSLDGKALAYHRYSSEQSTWVTLISGRPGSGKSVLLNNINLETCLIPGQKELPYICIIDIGTSSSGAIDLIRESLPPEQRHLVVHKRLQNNNREQGINPMDTYLGLRQPVPGHFDNIVSFLVAMVTPPERRGEPLEGMTDFVRNVLAKAYESKSDRSANPEPNEYTKGRDPYIDAAVEKLGLEREANDDSPQLTYWEITDACFEAEMLHEAEVAQRYATPILNDLVEEATSLREEYAKIRTNNGTAIVDAFINAIRSAVKEFPMFSDITKFDIGSARIVALDLQNVASANRSPDVVKRSSLMYMMARESFMKKISFHHDLVPWIQATAPLYTEHYRKLADKLVDIRKLLSIDETHVTQNNENFVQQIENDSRLGRKLQLEIVLASQNMEDMARFAAFATSFFILDKGDDRSQEWMRHNISLTMQERGALNRFVNGPSRVGSTFLAKFKTAKSVCSQLFTLTLGPKRLWALSTTSEDMRLRRILYDKMAKPTARALLAERFPGGSCKRYVEERAMRIHNPQSSTISEKEKSSANLTEVEKLAEELIQVYNNNPSKYDVMSEGV